MLYLVTEEFFWAYARNVPGMMVTSQTVVYQPTNLAYHDYFKLVVHLVKFKSHTSACIFSL